MSNAKSLNAHLKAVEQVLSDSNERNDHSAIHTLNAFVQAVEAPRDTS